MVKNPATLAQTMRRRILFTGESGVLSTTGPVALGGAFATGGVGAAGLAGGVAGTAGVSVVLGRS